MLPPTPAKPQKKTTKAGPEQRADARQSRATIVCLHACSRVDHGAWRVCTGTPGAIVVEGREDCVREMMVRLRRLAWQSMEVRGEAEHRAGRRLAAPLRELPVSIPAHPSRSLG